jgi:hypothetical protein
MWIGGWASAKACCSAARRSIDGVFIWLSSPMASRSNATKLAGVAPDSNLDPARCRMDPLLQASKSRVLPSQVGDNDFPVDHRPLREVREHRFDDLREVPSHWRSLRLPISTGRRHPRRPAL